MVCRHFGLDTGARSFPSIALWSKDKAVLKGVLSTIWQESAKIIAGIAKTPARDEGNRMAITAT